MNGLFVTGIDTEVGKTVVSALLVKGLGMDYWKPVQSGDLDYGDTDKVKEWTTGTDHHFFSERYRLNTPASPHYSAAIDGVEIQLSDFELPSSERPILVEGAGGLMVPLNDSDLMIDLIAHLQLPVVLVSKNYLGSINHTILSIKALQSRGITIAALIFNGVSTPSTESIIQQMTGVTAAFRLDQLEEVNASTIAAATEQHTLALTNLKDQWL